ncbi:hypothetical protein AAC387_Pa02g1415 [Persea americana]
MAEQTLLQVLLAAQPDNPNRIHHKPISGQLNLLGLQSHPIEPQSPSTPFVDRPKPNPRENKWKKREERSRIREVKSKVDLALGTSATLDLTNITLHFYLAIIFVITTVVFIHTPLQPEPLSRPQNYAGS